MIIKDAMIWMMHLKDYENQLSSMVKSENTWMYGKSWMRGTWSNLETMSKCKHELKNELVWWV